MGGRKIGRNSIIEVIRIIIEVVGIIVIAGCAVAFYKWRRRPQLPSKEFKDDIDRAEWHCDRYIAERTHQCRMLMIYQFVLLFAAFCCVGIFVYYFLEENGRKVSEMAMPPIVAESENPVITPLGGGADAKIDSEETQGSPPKNGLATGAGDSSNGGEGGEKNTTNTNQPEINRVGPSLVTTMIIALGIGYGILTTVMMASFRSFQRDIDRAQRTKIDFWRISTAAQKQYSEVRKALTEGVFIFPEDYQTGKGKKGIDLLPGHPLYELSKKIIESIEIKIG